MSELKAMTVINAYQLECNDNDLVYLKSEADKVIAELKQKINKLQTELELWRDGSIISEAHQKELDEKRHSDYKRCLGMAKWCKAEQTYSSFAIYITEHPKSRWANKSVGAGSWIAFWKNREQRWLDIAEKFKPNSTAQYGKG